MDELTALLTQLGQQVAPGAADPIAAARLYRECKAGKGRQEWLLRSALLPARTVCPRCRCRLWLPHPYCRHEAHALLSFQPDEESQSFLRLFALKS